MATIDQILVAGGDVSKLALRGYLAGREIGCAEDYGAIGDGVVDDAPALNAALAATGTVRLKPGVYRVAQSVELPAGAGLIGSGYATALVADADSHPVVTLTAGDATVRGLRLVGGSAGLKAAPRDGHVWHCRAENLVCEDNHVGVLLDGYSAEGYRLYWNHFQSISVIRPRLHGVLLDKTAGGSDDDTPNANKFRDLHVFSHGQPLNGGHGIYLKQANFMNALVDCEANVHTDAGACVRVGDNTQTNALINLYTESQAEIANVQLDPGSKDTKIINLFAASAGPAIYDLSGGNYHALNAGWPETYTLRRGRATDLTVERLRHDIGVIDTPGVHTLDLTRSLTLVSAFSGEVTVTLPIAFDAPGQLVILKKTDVSTNPVTVTVAGGATGPDGGGIVLSKQYDHVAMVSNGSSWYVTARGYPQAIGGWTSPTGPGFQRGGFAADWDVAVGFDYDRNTLIAVVEQVKTLTRTLNAAILDLKTLRLFGEP